MGLHQQRRLSADDLDAYVQFYAAQARENFWAYRQFMDPTMIKGWFPRDISYKLQLFYDRLIAGKRPKLVLMAPPQHGKTRNLQDFISWVAGKNPDIKTIYASFSNDLGIITNSAVQRTFMNPNHGLVFPDFAISSESVVTQVGKPKRNSSLIEYSGHKGYFRNATVQGQITGKTLGLGIVDDPLKGREAASSKTVRDKTWDWLMDDYFSRFEDQAGMILTATRWHVDDPTARFMDKFSDCIVLRYPALATPDNVRKYDPRTVEGEPLFPEFKSKAFLLERREAYSTSSWESLYQQSPIVQGGGIFPLDRIRYTKALPDLKQIKKSVRYWDKAGTADGGAFTAGVLMHSLTEGGWLISDVVRGQWSAWDRERIIKATAQRDAEIFGQTGIHIWTEQEPGSGGLESAQRTIANLAGFSAFKDKVTGSKEVRADPYAAQWQGGNITLLSRPQGWNDAFVDEHEAWPTSKYKDQVDAAAGAFAQLVNKKYAYDTSMKWADT
jgi:predicted phage terminase large subunit-like protein